jgi:hypothetical protein
MFIKAFAKKAPIDPLNPEKRVSVSGIIYCRARAMVSDSSTLESNAPADFLTCNLTVRSSSRDASRRGYRCETVPSRIEESRAGQDVTAMARWKRRMRSTCNSTADVCMNTDRHASRYSGSNDCFRNGLSYRILGSTLEHLLN